ncbi:hypothetical protein LZQ00_03225 [Sphingobacterium sp. SRCM116780]|uniref:hypothetical protein n=1 Tax=Sphingobacterium sp. SRCM116780 TaxID=2907623 RepID=UPI001F1F179D|nr:hypothetical protein [Sphingobacterium sp. SRCM116780]UIR56837.1 hypothetical protein LZQ00_03225 [Sphingobacterium sp. SRCM116780]
MKENILVNNVRIAKVIIYDFIKQHNSADAIEFICNQANVRYKTGRDIVEMFKDGHIDRFDGIDLFLDDYDTVPNTDPLERDERITDSILEHDHEQPKSGFKNGLIFLLCIFLIGFVVIKYVVGFHHVGHHLRELKDVVFGSNKGVAAIDVDSVANKGVLKVDTTDFALTSADLYPVDTNNLIPEIRATEIKIIKYAHFDKLKRVTDPPTDEDAQAALIRLTEGRLADVIVDQKLNIKIGTCYENPNKDGNFRCVSCMILLYNRDKKDWQEAPNGENFLSNAYDFYQPSKGDVWEAKELSIRIPYDYALIHKYERKD